MRRMWKHILTVVVNLKMSWTGVHAPEGTAQPTAGGPPQPTVGGAKQQTDMPKKGQNEWFPLPPPSQLLTS